MSEAQAARTPSSLPWLNWISPGLLAVVGWGLGGGTLLLALIRLLAWALGAGFLQAFSLNDWIANDTLIGLGIVAVSSLIASWVLFNVKNAERDRVLTIYALGVFVALFWAASEQAGNAMNLWADKTTDRYLSSPAPTPSAFPETANTGANEGAASAAPAPSGGLMRWVTMWQLKPAASQKNQSWYDWWVGLWNPVSTEWFQSINPLAIFVLAPPFAFLWVWLDRRRINPSTPVKMAFGLLLMSAAGGLMIFSAQWEDGPTDVKLAGNLPQKVHLNDKNELVSTEAGRPFQAGRLTYDAATHTLHLHGVLADTEHDLMVRETAPDCVCRRAQGAAKEVRRAARRRLRQGRRRRLGSPGSPAAGLRPALRRPPRERSLLRRRDADADRDQRPPGGQGRQGSAGGRRRPDVPSGRR